jgi:hypothetical protein
MRRSAREPDLFGPFTRTRLSDPDTSREAADSVAPKMTALRATVLGHFARRRSLTDLELEGLCADHGSTYRTRRSELVQMGLVEDSGERREQRGSNRVVWVITPQGLEAAKIFWHQR